MAQIEKKALCRDWLLTINSNTLLHLYRCDFIKSRTFNNISTLSTFFFYWRLSPGNKVTLSIRVLLSWRHNSSETRELFWHWFYSRKCIFQQSGSVIFRILVTETDRPLPRILKLIGCNAHPIFAHSSSVPTFLFETVRSSRSQMFFKIGVLKIFSIFTGKHLCWSLFLIKLQALRSYNTFFFIEHLWWLLLNFDEIHRITASRYPILAGENQLNLCTLWFLVQSHEETLSGKTKLILFV